MIAYKAFYSGLKGAGGFQYAIGKTAANTNLGLGNQGLHASFDPIFCLLFITPSRGGEYAEVDVSGEVDMGSPHAAWDGFGKSHVDCVTGSRLTVLRLLTPEEMALKAVDYRISRAKKYGVLVRTSDSRYGFAQTAQLRGTAVADSPGSEATASADYASAFAIAPGSRASADGTDSFAAALAPQSWARGNTVLLRDWERPDEYRLVMEGKGRYYALRDGKLMTR